MNTMFDIRLHIVFLSCMCFASQIMCGQMQKNGSSLYPTLDDPKEPLYSELRALPHASPDSMMIMAMFRIQYDALIFERSTSFRGEYVAMPTLEIEIKDTNGIIRGRIQWKDSVFAQTFEQSNDTKGYVFGMRSVILQRNHYVVTLALLDKGRVIKKFRLPSIALREIGQPLFTSGNPFSNVFTPDIYNGNIPFGSTRQYAVFPLSSSISVTSATLNRQRANEEYSHHVKPITSTRTELRNNASIMPENLESSASFQPFPLLINEANGLQVLIVQFPDNVIAPGRYSLVLHHGEKKGKQDSTRFDFACQWEDMPTTLISAEYARQVMKYLLTDDEFDKLSASSDLDIRKKIIDWWKKNDPTPTTIYDEPMTEYFKRADRAFTEFQTITESDGIMTQRGKIALLYGFPKKRDMEIPSQGVRKEIWTYPSPINKRFIFVQQSGKNFVLIAIEDV
jgi:GWxTD domain-containing protein